MTSSLIPDSMYEHRPEFSVSAASLTFFDRKGDYAHSEERTENGNESVRLSVNPLDTPFNMP